MRFVKMNGAGNSFIILDGIRGALDTARLPELARALCDPNFGVGADGLMAVLPADDADFTMRFYNSDGSLGEMCGNGARCICRYGYETGLSGKRPRVRTTAGLVTGERMTAEQYRVRLPDATVMQPDRVLTVDGRDIACAYVELGSPGLPHLAVELPGLADAADDDLRALARALRYHPALPKGANVNFYTLTGKDAVLLRTYERGVEDFTCACGTGTGAVVSVLTLAGRVSGTAVRVKMRGGVLTMDVTARDGTARDLFLTGPARLVARGEVFPEELLKNEI